MTGLAELLGLGSPAEQARIRHDLGVLRRHGLAELRHQIDGRPVPADLYLAALAQITHRAQLREATAAADWDRAEADDENRQVRRGGNR